VSLAGLCFVAIFSLRFPYADEWEWIGRVTGNEPVTLSWLWSQHNEHRMFLPRLIYFALGWLSGFDFRAGAFFYIFILSGLSLAMMATVRVFRGQTRLYDAFFPLLLMHWGQYDNLIWGFQLNFVTSVVVEGIILLMVSRCGDGITFKLSILLSLCLILLGLCGSYGIVYLPPMICWLLYAAARKWRGNELHSKSNAMAIFIAAMVPASLVAFYLHGLHTTHYSPNFYSTLRTMIQFASCGIGQTAKDIWPLSGVVALFACAIIAKNSLSALLKQPAERLKAAGYLSFVAGFVALALAIGVGRTGPMIGFEPRCITLAMPLLILLFLQCESQMDSFLKLYVPRILFILACILFVVNVQKGIVYSTHLWRHVAQYIQDMRDEVPPYIISLRHENMWGQGHVPPEVFATRLAWLREAKLGPYERLSSKTWEIHTAENLGPQARAVQK
jgi:hypothetical protein